MQIPMGYRSADGRFIPAVKHIRQEQCVTYRWESLGRRPLMTRLRRLWNAVLEADLLRPWGERKGLTYNTNDTKMEDMKQMEDQVKNPSHYNHGKIEVWDIIDAFSHLNYHLLVAIKYILRAPYKGRQVDLDKAINELQRMKELMNQGELGYSREVTRNKPEVTE